MSGNPSTRSPGRSRGRAKDDASATGSTASARRRRSRSPLRKVQKSTKSILGRMKSKKSTKKPYENLDDISELEPETAPKAAVADDASYGVVLDKERKAPPVASVSAPAPASPLPAKSTKPAAPSTPTSTGPPGPPLQVVLLLMDPKTRRFELLQLEFDSDKAVVADVLSQIALSATEESLRVQTYEGVSDRNGGAMDAKTLLSDFCKANDVILAIPSGLSAKDCAKLAKPILGDAKVISMLNPAASPAPVAEEKKPKTKSRDLPTISEPTSSRGASVEKDGGEKKSSSFGGIVGILLPVILAAIIYRLHEFVTAPLAPGDVLSPGMFRSKCGVLSVLPESITGCQPALVKMGQDGVLSMYHGNTLIWEMTGGVCKEGDDDCESGAVVNEDGRVVIGGGKVTLKGELSEPLSPWPFTVDPKKGWF